jgi:hypothetical protein
MEINMYDLWTEILLQYASQLRILLEDMCEVALPPPYIS